MQLSLVVVVGAALCVAMLLIWFHKSLIYQFDETPASPEAVGIVGLRHESFLSPDGQMIRAWISQPVGDAPVMLFFPGNFSSSIASVKKLLPFVERCYGIAVLEYQGMGGAPGVPSEHNFRADARELYDQLDTLMGHHIAAERRVLYGFSLGTGVAIPLALERKAAALVLESPFASLTDFFTRKFRGLPMNWLMRSERYDMLAPVAALNIPTMLLRGELDNAIPVFSFDALAQSASPQTIIKRYPAAGHADLAKHGAVEDILDFVQKNTSAAPAECHSTVQQ